MEATRARALLEAEAQRLAAASHGSVGTEGAGALEPPEADPDQVAAGADLLERELELAIGHRLDADRAAVAAALARLDAGTYGRCEGCGEPIPDERLAAVPATRFCLGHEAVAETMIEANGVEGDDRGFDAEELARREAQRHLDLVPDEDAPDDEASLLGVEELSIHLDRD